MIDTDPHSDRAELAPTRSSTRARRRRSGRLCLAFRISASARLCAVLVIAAATLAVGPGAAAAPPDKVSFPVDVSYPVDELAEFCGFDVWFSMMGTFKGTLFRDRTGIVVGEFDSQPNTRIAFSSRRPASRSPTCSRPPSTAAIPRDSTRETGWCRR